MARDFKEIGRWLQQIGESILGDKLGKIEIHEPDHTDGFVRLDNFAITADDEGFWIFQIHYHPGTFWDPPEEDWEQETEEAIPHLYMAISSLLEKVVSWRIGDKLEAIGEEISEKSLAEEHDELVHPDGSECPDGCGGV